MKEEKKFLDFEGLQFYDEQIKKLIKANEIEINSTKNELKNNLEWGSLGTESM